MTGPRAQVELSLKVNSAMMNLNADDLVDAVSAFMEFHNLSVAPEQVAKIPKANDMRSNRADTPEKTAQTG